MPNARGLSTEEFTITTHLFLFWKHTRWTIPTAGRFGSSWVEISVFYQASGGALFPADLHCALTLTTKKSFKAQLVTFTRMSRALLKQIGTSSKIDLLKPPREQRRRLQAYGVIQHLPCITAALCLIQAAAQTMHLRPISLMSCKKPSEACARRQLCTKLRVGKLKMVRHPPLG